MKRFRVVLATSLFTPLILAGCGSDDDPGDTEDPGVVDLATYEGDDRQELLEEAARKESGKLIWYTSTVKDQVADPMAAAFTKKYPFIQVEVWQGSSSEVTKRVAEEYGARRYDVDVADGTTAPAAMQEAGLLQPYYSPELEEFSSDLKDPEGYWGAQLQYLTLLAYNTNVMSEDEAPKTYEDLLKPEYKGKMAWSAVGSGAPLFIGNVLDVMGDEAGREYLEKLAEQEVVNLSVIGNAVLDQLIAAQFPIGLNLFADQIELAASQGAPVKRVNIEPVNSNLARASLPAKATDPASALLFLDFMFSEEGQDIIRESGAVPARPGVEPKFPSLDPEIGGFEVNVIDPDDVYSRNPEWQEIHKELFVD